MIEVDLIAIDLDGVLLERDGTILPAVKRALAEVVKRGVKIATASGRCLKYQVSSLKRNRLGISSGGASS
ncbi:MAG: hydrolase [Candidatus Bathyarchaeota archaeon B63]|nr:MAG: hydrolase [Candidatus Bathyarchaeota archaeon B63]